MSETERDSGWSERYAETGGWPPPGEGQRRYGPGTTPPPAAGTGTGQPASGWGQATDDPHAGRWTQPPHGADPAETGGYPGQSGQRAAAGTGGQPGQAGQPGGSGQPAQWGQAAGYGQDGQSGQAGGYGQAGQPGQAGGQPGQWEQAGSAGQWAQGEQGGAASSAWAPGDSAYGRLERGSGPARPQRPRRPWDGRPTAARRPTGTRTPVVTYTLVGICVVIYLIQQANPSFTTRYGLIPYAVEQGQYARLITSAFLHASVLHLATNMITLFIVGTPLERVLRPARYLVVYLLSALGGSLLSVWLSPQFSIGVGASGAIFGLFGALVVLRRQVGAEAGGLVVLIGLNLVISFAVPNISWQAHIGGLVTGVLVALALMGVDRLSRRPAT